MSIEKIAMIHETNSLALDILKALFGERLQQNVKMSRFSTARVGGPVDFLVIARSSDELETDILKLWQHHIPFKLIGGASNVLVSEKGFRGLVLINQARSFRVSSQTVPPVVWAESGVSMNTIVRQAAEESLSGLEWATGLPGTLGGAIYGNAGAFGSEISQNLIMAEILHASNRKLSWKSEDFEYQYRSSNLKRHPDLSVVILSATLQLSQGNQEEIKNLMNSLKGKRETKQPPGACTGSMFKNPVGNFAGQLIEAASLKGTKIGDVEISLKHGNFFINNGSGTADDFWGLIKLTQENVAQKFGIDLELEVELLGDWD